MSLHVYSLAHTHAQLDVIAEAARMIDTYEDACASDVDISGFLILSTCNRVEVYFSTYLDDDALVEKCPFLATWKHHVNRAAIAHLFSVAAGLESMVKGEREIMGQVRRAFDEARRKRYVDLLIDRVFSAALSSARTVSHIDGLESLGRSVVSVGLDMVENLNILPLHQANITLIGTGSYAGATVAALRKRSVDEITSYSVSDRGPSFAQRHDLRLIDEGAFTDTLRTTDVLITCRGHAPIISHKQIARVMEGHKGDLIILDLALTHDVDPEVSSLEGVHLIAMEDIQRNVPDVAIDDIAKAYDIVNAGVEELISRLKERHADQIVMHMRSQFAKAVEKEVANLPSNGSIPVEQAVRALHRLANRLAHTPTINAHAAAKNGDADKWEQAYRDVFEYVPEEDIRVDAGVSSVQKNSNMCGDFL